MNTFTLSLLLRLPLIVLALAACFYSAIVAGAIHLAQSSNPESIRRAIQLIPFSPDFFLKLDSALPQSSPQLLRQALTLNPFQSEAWIRLGIDAEMRERNPSRAETYYRKAAEIDRMYLPEGTLANFYDRQQDAPKFFEAAKRALALTPYDSRPILAEAAMLARNPDEVLAIVPDRPHVLFDYLNMLLANGNVEQIAVVALRAASHRPDPVTGPPELTDTWRGNLGSVEDRLLQSARREDAIHIWTAMQRHGWVSAPAPSLSNPIPTGSLHEPVFGHGFGWWRPQVSGVLSDQFPSLGKLTFSFDGTEAETCRLLQRFIPVAGAKSYNFNWQAESLDLQGSSGLRWRIYPVLPENDKDRVFLTSPEVLKNGQQDGSWQFVTPAGWRVALVTLEYERPLGQVRAEGSVSLSNISITEPAAVN
ncbi:MAG TPA: hypothetical protein VN633_21835 [Bryobacteraceae bacterium]|nr:hypothetical protein [Bryobacteraceae bacterium]